ncbi:tyrosine-type recombinase/integrase [Nonomuraea sp. K274]|uniref:Tyrosine-type recombinase/integrase n=1 Tax=Nonomuraea cypriaca TaxID=1187855 RepID=A0A931EZS2_9ACTN|nr:tyrosine-type recombinase/integrase [Nonomuraea cypriaca]MBF8185513.1 tyrosine-type recombinase/integrase [Nonomuraea cypriaca]
MTAMHDHVREYLRLRRALGFKLDWPGRILPQFADYLLTAGSSTITDELSIAWAQLPTGVHPVTWTHRLGVVRGFAKYMQAIDPATQIPPSGVFPGQGKRPDPYLFSEHDITSLLEATRTLKTPLRAATCHALFGLLAVSGVRISEALTLQRDGVDLDSGVLAITSAKSGPPRLVPLHPTATAALSEYADLRDRLRPRARASTFFISHRGTPLSKGPVREAFIQLTAAIGIRTATVKPRIHDLRHSFAVHCLLRWYRSGADVDGQMATLPTYLGHLNPAGTFWYLSAVPELMQLAAQRLQASTAAS